MTSPAERVGKELKLLRIARKWSQERLIVELERRAPELGVHVAARPSLRTLVSNWENGKRFPTRDYQKLLALVHGVREDDLFPSAGAVDLNAPIMPEARPHGSVAATPELAVYLRSVFSEYARADNLLGSRHLLGVVAAQLAIVEQACAAARGPIRSELLEIGARYAECAGWLHQDSGDIQSAQRWSSRALDFAYELGEPQLTSYVLMRRSNVATDAGDAGAGLGLANAALRDADRLTPGLRAVALRQRAHAHALAGEPDDCARAIDETLSEVAEPPESDGLTAYCTPSYVAMEAGDAWMHLDRPAHAIPIYEDGLRRWPSGFERDRGLCLSRLAVAYAVSGQVEQAAITGRQAAAAVGAASSARSVAQLRRLRIRLAPHRSMPDVAELDRVLAGVA